MWLALIFVALLLALVPSMGFSKALQRLVLAAIVLRVVGAAARHFVIEEFYGGVADASVYFSWGEFYAGMIRAGDFAFLDQPQYWLRTKVWGTQFVSFVSGFVLSIIGSSRFGAFIVFSLFAFLGLAGFVFAFRRIYPHIPVTRYARWVWLFPALWFWPSSLGKEALIVMGLGVAVAGFAWSRNRINWLLLIPGVFLVFAVRPPLAAVLIFCLMVAHWLPNKGGGWNLRTLVHGVVILALGSIGLQYALAQMGVDSLDIQEIGVYIEDMAGQSEGQSQIEVVGPGLSGIPIAFVNILFRPFPWDVSNAMMALAAMETIALWTIAWYRRRNLMNALRNWRSDRFLRLAIVFIPMYAVLTGMLFANLGIIARQRIFIFPFLFLLMEAVPARPRRRGRAMSAHFPRADAYATVANHGAYWDDRVDNRATQVHYRNRSDFQGR